MLSSSLLLKLVVPYVTALSLIAFALLYVVPQKQKDDFLEDVTAQLSAISQTAANGVEIAIEEEDFSSLSMINRLLESNPNVSFAAIYVEEDGGSELFALYPSELADDTTFSVDAERYLMHSHPIETDLFNGRVLVGYDATLFEEQAQQLNSPVYMAFAFVLLVQFWSYRTISRSVVQPIRRAAVAADALGAGGLDSPLQLAPREDEIGQLHDSLRNLQSSLQGQRSRNDELMASLEERVRERTAELQEALSTKDHFLSSVSHELRTPLHGIISSLELQLQTAGETNQSDDSIEVVRNGLVAARSLLTLINDLLDYQKFASQGIELNPKSTSMIDLLQRLESVVNPLFQSSAVRLRSEYAECEGLWVRVDPQRLEQILVNLVGNACKFTREGEVALDVRVESTDDGARCTFAISDTGIGMDEDTIRRLGEPFFQSTEGYSRKFGGTGLGLSIVKRLLEAMDSHIEVHSVLGEGSTFSFALALPVVESEAAVSDGAPQDLALSERLRVLYVEDMEINQFFMRATAKQLNVELVLASSALEGYEKIKNEEFDLVLTDIQMPEHDGTELVRWVRENSDIPPGLQVVAFTAHAEQERVEQFLDMGFNSVLTKPLRIEELRLTLEHVQQQKS